MASLVVFRVMFGVLAVAGAVRFLGMGWVEALYIEPSFHFSYPGFSWVKPLPGVWMYAPFIAMILGGVGIVWGGRWYRGGALFYFVGLTYVELIDPSYYLNHYYFLSLLSFGLIWMPLHKHVGGQGAAWMLWALRAQVGIVYFFAGVAKINHDWLFYAEPLRTWLGVKALMFPEPVGVLLARPEVAYAMSYGGVLFDLTIPFWLSWGRSRVWAYGAVLGFHVITGALFQIGIFPWVMSLSALVFFPADWPRRVFGGVLARWLPSLKNASTYRVEAQAIRSLHEGWVMTGLAIYFSVQLVLPLRHLLYPGDRLWSEEGFNFSWHVMVMEKGGRVDFMVTDATKARRWLVDPDEHLDAIQAKVLSTNPEFMRQFAHYLADDFAARGVIDVEVRAITNVSLNGQSAQPMIDPSVDLSKEPWRWGPAPWILPRVSRGFE